MTYRIKKILENLFLLSEIYMKGIFHIPKIRSEVRYPIFSMLTTTSVAAPNGTLRTFPLTYHLRYMTDAVGYLQQSTIWRCTFESTVMETTNPSKYLSSVVV